jgi:hypothetical protein
MSSHLSLPQETLDELRAAATRFCTWCEGNEPLTPHSVHAMIQEVLRIYLLCAQIPPGVETTDVDSRVPRSNTINPNIDQHLAERVAAGIAAENARFPDFVPPTPRFLPIGLGDLYDFMVVVRESPELDGDLLFSLRIGYIDGWGGSALCDLARLHDAFMLPVL